MDGHAKKKVFTLREGVYKCPICTTEIRWTCHGDKGRAYCGRASDATRVWERGEFDTLTFCDWKGFAERRPDGAVEIWYYPQ